MTTASASRRYSKNREEVTRWSTQEWTSWCGYPFQLEAEGNDLLGEMVCSFAQGLMSAEVDVVCGAAWGAESGSGV